MRAHFLFEADGVLRDMLWWQVGDDGSLVMSPRYKPAPPTAKIGIAKRTGSSLTIPLEGTDVHPQKLHDRKVTHHSSGLIRAYGHRVRSHELRALGELTKIGAFVFAHPFKFEPPTRKKKQTGYLEVPGRALPTTTPFGNFDVVDGVLQLGPTYEAFRLAPTMPLIGSVYVCPLERAAPHERPRGGRRAGHVRAHDAYAFPFTDLTSCQDLMVSFVFGCGRVTKWPPVSIYLFERLKESDQD